MPAKKVSHGDTEVTESGPDAADVDGSPASHLLKTPFEYEYEYRCAEYEYEEIRESEIALLSVLLRALRVSVRGFFQYFAAENASQRCLKGRNNFLPLAAASVFSAP